LLRHQHHQQQQQRRLLTDLRRELINSRSRTEQIVRQPTSCSGNTPPFRTGHEQWKKCKWKDSDGEVTKGVKVEIVDLLYIMLAVFHATATMRAAINFAAW